MKDKLHPYVVGPCDALGWDPGSSATVARITLDDDEAKRLARMGVLLEEVAVVPLAKLQALLTFCKGVADLDLIQSYPGAGLAIMINGFRRAVADFTGDPLPDASPLAPTAPLELDEAAFLAAAPERAP